MNSWQRMQRGVGLIEILLSVVLISIGFLAAASMQVQGMRFSQSAYYQSQAYFLASDMIDRMRVNSDAVANGDYDNQGTASDATDPGCQLKACTAGEMAQQDLYEWSARFHSFDDDDDDFVPVLPSGDGVLAGGQITPLENNVLSVVMRWAEQIDGNDVAQSLTLNFVGERP